MTPPTPRLAFVGTDHQLHVMEPGAAPPQQVTWPKALDAVGRWGGTSAADGASWPCWSPDGRWLACFEVDGPGGGAAVGVVEVDGVEERIVHQFDGRMPIHLQWSPRGDCLAVLMQHTEALELWLCPVEGGGARLLATGSPLFFHWTPDGGRLLLHVGDGDDGPPRLELRDAVGAADDQVFRVPPGSFCTPMVAGRGPTQRVVYAIRRGLQTQLVSCDLHGEGLLGLALVDGLAALVVDPTGTMVAYSSAPAADGSPYQGVSVVEVLGGSPRRLVDAPVLAFFWTPDGQRLVWCQWRAGRNRLAWFSRGLGPDELPVKLAEFWPTRDQLFQLHFFEQFASSHPMVSPCSQWLVWAGHEGEVGGPRDEDVSSRTPRVRRVRVDGSMSAPEVVAPGSYAVFRA